MKSMRFSLGTPLSDSDPFKPLSALTSFVVIPFDILSKGISLSTLSVPSLSTTFDLAAMSQQFIS